MKNDLSKRRPFFCFLLAFAVCLATGSASAHRVNVFAWVENDTIHVESKFPGGKRVKGAKIVVVDLQGNELLAGTTDAQGEFSFQAPRPTDLKIILTAGQGHQAQWTISAAELRPAAVSRTPSRDREHEAPKIPAGTVPEKTASKPASQLNMENIQATMESVLDKKLNPVIRALAANRQQEPAVKDILGGIGYIVGLVGIVAYVQSRRKKK